MRFKPSITTSVNLSNGGNEHISPYSQKAIILVTSWEVYSEINSCSVGGRICAPVGDAAERAFLSIGTTRKNSGKQFDITRLDNIIFNLLSSVLIENITLST